MVREIEGGLKLKGHSHGYLSKVGSMPRFVAVQCDTSDDTQKVGLQKYLTWSRMRIVITQQQHIWVTA
jgi:hypothetical protein